MDGEGRLLFRDTLGVERIGHTPVVIFVVTSTLSLYRRAGSLLIHFAFVCFLSSGQTKALITRVCNLMCSLLGAIQKFFSCLDRIEARLGVESTEHKRRVGMR